MFNLGPFELVAIFVVALLVFGPEKLPEMGKQVGRAYREFKKFQDSMQTHVRDVLEPITGPIISNGPVRARPDQHQRGQHPRSARPSRPRPPVKAAAVPARPRTGRPGPIDGASAAAAGDAANPPPTGRRRPAAVPPASSTDHDAR